MGQLAKQTHSKLSNFEQKSNNIRYEWVDDFLLAKKAFRGKEEAWDALYSKSYDRVSRYVRKICFSMQFDSDMAEDITEEAFARCYSKLDEFRGFSLFSTWVCGFSRFILLENARKEYKQQRLRAVVRQCEFHNISADPLDIIIATERNLCVKIAFNSLSKYHQKLLWLNIIDEMPEKDMSDFFSCPIEKIFRDLAKAKKYFKKQFSQLYYYKSFVDS